MYKISIYGCAMFKKLVRQWVNIFFIIGNCCVCQPVFHFRVIHKAANCWVNDSSCVLMYDFIVWKILDPVSTELALFDRMQLLRMICGGSGIYSALLHLCRGCNRTLLHLYHGPRIYRVSQKEWTKLRESVPYVKIYQYNPKHLYPKLNGYGDNGQRSLKV